MRRDIFLQSLFLILHQYSFYYYHDLIILTEGFYVNHPSTIITRQKIIPPIKQSSKHLSLDFDVNYQDKETCHNKTLSSRRFFLGKSILFSPSLALLFSQSAAHGQGGLIKFPCTRPLGNTYHFIRAGQTLLEAEDILSTNPLFVTNREAALSPKGVKQVEQAATFLKSNNIFLTSIRFAIGANSAESADIIGRELNVGRSNIVPEYNYLEPRAVGEWDKEDLERTQAAVWAMDVLEAGETGREGQPPPNEDGTPNEILADVAVRLVQLLSVMETQYSGDTVLVIGCDGTTLALMSCMISGIPFNRVHELEFLPGEVRLDVNYESTLILLKERQASLSEDYKIIIEKGKTELKRLRSSSSNTEN
mmetsp:Transcript_37887/g.43275  ORF Transcript_37887/g.43275 Transcript_37887/m.43275 type:complete len:364 (+) Transcript_37887:109-1200(+)